MGRNAHTARSRRFRNAWVYAASAALAVFTVFVLLDTFAIARVHQVAQAADYSSIVAAQGEVSAEAPGESDEASSPSDEANASTSAEDASSESAASSKSLSSSASSASRPHGKGKPGGKHGGTSGGSDGSDSASSSSSSSSGKRTGSSSSAAASDSAVVAGAGSAASAGTQVGSYSDENMQITVSKVRAYDTDIYVADIQVSSAEYLKTALAQGSYGRNLKDTTSNMADEAGAVLAINGDYYGFRDDGYVLRNGVLYRETAASGTDALVIYGDGTMAAASQDTTTAQQLKDAGAWQVLSFGPVLVSDGELAVSAGDEVDQAMGSNPRTAIGMVSPLHYVVVVSDGRTGDDDGLSLYQLAQVLVDNGATFAYNLDGGGSTTLYFQGEVLNNPSSGNRSGERSVSDIVYFG